MHYITRQQSEISFKNGDLNTLTHYLIPYSVMRTRAQNLLENINILDYTEELGDWADWLEKYIQFLDTYTYFSDKQDNEIMEKLIYMEKKVALLRDPDAKAATDAKVAADGKLAVPFDSDQLKTNGLTEKQGGKSKRIFKRNVKSKKRSKKKSKKRSKN